MEHFSHNYKLVDEKKNAKEEVEEDADIADDSSDEEVLVVEDKETTSTEYRQWKTLARANHTALELLCELVALASNDEDEDFEEMEDDEAQMQEDK